MSIQDQVPSVSGSLTVRTEPGDVVVAEVHGRLDDHVARQLQVVCQRAVEKDLAHICLGLTSMTGATPSAAQAVIACLQLMDRLPGGYTLKTSTPSY